MSCSNVQIWKYLIKSLEIQCSWDSTLSYNVTSLEEFRDSRWALSQIFNLVMNVNKYNPMRAGYDSRSAFFSGYRAATSDHTKHALSIERTDHRSFRYYFSWYYFDMTSCALGLCLFTFITKLRICDNAHPLSRNSSSDVNVDSMTCCSYHLRKSAYRYISMFLVFILLISFIVRRKLVERDVHFYRVFL